MRTLVYFLIGVGCAVFMNAGLATMFDISIWVAVPISGIMLGLYSLCAHFWIRSL